VTAVIRLQIATVIVLVTDPSAGKPGLRLQYFSILVPTYEAGIDFFVRILGFTLIENTRRNDTKRWVRVVGPGGGGEILLAVPSSEQQADAIGSQTGGKVGFFLYAEEFSEEYDRLKALGLDFQEPVRNETYGQVCVFRDPFGNLWDLLGPPS
jgi:catechol 2,3-dioxygenase-like lactoylglutathione lyase family enzyme